VVVVVPGRLSLVGVGGGARRTSSPGGAFVCFAPISRKRLIGKILIPYSDLLARRAISGPGGKPEPVPGINADWLKQLSEPGRLPCYLSPANTSVSQVEAGAKTLFQRLFAAGGPEGPPHHY
jgi:hypothetical protein